MVVGAAGARTTPFKTVRIDEVARRRHDVTVETFDLSDIFLRMKAVNPATAEYTDQANLLRSTASWDGVPEAAFDNLVRREEYEQNQRRLRENAQGWGADRRKSPPREGPALLQGLVVCGVCGNRMTVRYHTQRGLLYG